LFSKIVIFLSNVNKSSLCKSYYTRKSHIIPFCESSFVYSPLELIFTNLWEPAYISFDVGYKYYISFVDAFSR